MALKPGMKLIITAAAIAAVAGLGIYLAQRTPFEERNPRVGMKAPEIHLADLSGRMFGLADHSGKVVLVNFWAPWCPPCKSELEWFNKLYEEYGKDRFMVAAISVGDVTAKEVIKMGLTFPVIVANDRVKEAYGGVADVPVSFLVGKDGVVIKKVWKVYGEDDLRKDLEAALK